MHAAGFCHRDIKPENCMVERKTHRLKVITRFGGLVLNSPSEDGPGIMYIMHIMSPQLQKRNLQQGITNFGV
jgi:serine/threonine protein kinase